MYVEEIWAMGLRCFRRDSREASAGRQDYSLTTATNLNMAVTDAVCGFDVIMHTPAAT